VGDAVFEDPRLVRVDDAIEGDRADLETYVEVVAELVARSVLDIGCGTGTFARPLASRGIDLVADRSPRTGWTATLRRSWWTRRR
jgi:SAM-dependent methyltransferase